MEISTLKKGEREALLDLLDLWDVPDGWSGREFFQRYIDRDPTFVEDPSPSPVAHLLRAQEGARIREALSRLPAVQADVLRGAYFEHKSLPQIAQESNVPLGTVKSRVRLAFRSLRRTLGDEQ